MPTLYCIDGFEHGRGDATNASGPYDAIQGAPVTVTTPVRTGLRAMELSPAGAAESVSYAFAASNRIICESLYIRFATLPTAVVKLLIFVNASGQGSLKFDNVSGQLAVDIADTGIVTGGPVLAVDTWYRVDIEYDTSTGTAALSCQVDGGTQFQKTRVQAAADTTTTRLGTPDANTYTMYVDDWIISLTAGDYPIGAHYVERLKPNADGAHSAIPANTLEYSATGTDITSSSTDVWTLVDDDTVDTTPTDYINNVGDALTGGHYAEVAFADPATQADTPVDVRAYACVRESAAANASLGKAKFYDTDTTFATLNTDVWNAADPGTTVRTYARDGTNIKVLPRPSGGWTMTKVNALRARCGYGDGSPAAWFATLMAEVALLPAAAAATSLVVPTLTDIQRVQRSR